MPYTMRQKKAFARKLRRNMTRAERRLWPLYLLGFRPQVITPIGYIADWYNQSARVIVEADGGIHAITVDHDRERDKRHRRKGITTIRIPNHLAESHWRAPTILAIILLAVAWQLRRWFKLI